MAASASRSVTDSTGSASTLTGLLATSATAVPFHCLHPLPEVNIVQKLSKTILASVFAMAGSLVQAAPTTFVMDPDHTNVVASWSHLGFSHPSAHFGDVDGKIVYDADDIAGSSVVATIPLTGLDAYVEKFDEHLRSAELFDVAKFPNITFKSTKVEQGGAKGRLRVAGDLTVRGITKPVVLDVTLNGQGEHPMAKRQAIGFDATAKVKRSDFGLAYAVPAVSDEVEIRITTEALVPAVGK